MSVWAGFSWLGTVFSDGFLVDTVMDLRIHEGWGRSWPAVRLLISQKDSSPRNHVMEFEEVGLTESPIQWVPNALFPGAKWPSCEAEHFHLGLRLRMRGAIPPLSQ
jgi:hypothetical protein